MYVLKYFILHRETLEYIEKCVAKEDIVLYAINNNLRRNK